MIDKVLHMRGKILMIVFSLIGCCYTTAQEVVFHLDRPFYQAGQVIYYSLSIEGINEPEVISHMSLQSVNGFLANHFLELHAGAGHGYFQLPFDCDGGNYFLASELYDLDLGTPTLVAHIPVLIIRDTEVTEGALGISTLPSCPENEDIKIDLPSDLRNREVIACQIRIRNGKEGDLISVSVRDAGLFPNGQTTFVNEDLKEFGRHTNSMPIIANRILANAKRTESNIVFATIPEELSFRFGLLDEENRFRVMLPPFYGKKTLTFIDNASPKSKIELVDIFGTDQNLPISYGEELVAVRDVSTNRLRRKFYELNGQLEETIVPIKIQETPLKVSPDYQIDVQDFAIRGRLVDLLKELFSPFLFRKNNDGTFFLKVIYEVLGLKEFYKDEAVFYINGIGTRDFDYVANLPLQDIKTVDIYNELKTLRSLKLVDVGGVGIIEMMDPLFVIPEEKRLASKEIQGLQVPIHFPIVADEKSTFPQVKALLFWHPNLKLDENGECFFEIVASDDVSIFDLEVVHHASKTVQRTKLSIGYKNHLRDE